MADVHDNDDAGSSGTIPEAMVAACKAGDEAALVEYLAVRAHLDTIWRARTSHTLRGW